MVDPLYLRDHRDEAEARLRSRGIDPAADLDRLATLEAARRRFIGDSETLMRVQNAAANAVLDAKKDGRDAAEIIAQYKKRASEIDAIDAELKTVETERDQLLLTIPNLPHSSVPTGTSAADNQEVHRWGSPTAFDFAPKPHWELGAELGILDFERAAKMSGARFSVLLGAGARLARALINFMLDLHTREHGYREIEPPFLVNTKALTGTGNLPKFAEDLFQIAGEWDLFLIPTAEVPLTNLHREETLDEAVLPLKYTAYTPCFRSEAGSYGADVRGLIRQHQFDKVELVKFATPDQSHDELERLTKNAETVLERLELPYRRLLLCTADMGFASAKTYDIEVWLPSQQAYREISSCSNTEAFQARRAGIKFRPTGGGKTQFAHTLNGSGLAIGRTLVAILENFQQHDGSVRIPKALHAYMGGLEVIEPPR